MSSWLYDEFRQVGTDFSDPAVVATYDRNQRSSTADKEQALVQQLGIAAGHQVIDLGCGTGTFAIQAALAGATVHAVDVSVPMLAYARQKAEMAGVIEQIQFHHQGFLTYEHSEPLADCVVTQAALHHLPDFWKMIAFLRMANMLKPKGILYLWDTIYAFPPVEYQKQINAWIDRASGVSEGWTSADFATHVRDEYTTFNWVIESMLAQAGFVIEAIDRPTLTVSAYTCRKTVC